MMINLFDQSNIKQNIFSLAVTYRHSISYSVFSLISRYIKFMEVYVMNKAEREILYLQFETGRIFHTKWVNS